MLTKTLAAAAALSMLVAGGEALAAQKTMAPAIGPKAPIPYAQLDAYLKASPKTRASKDWWAGSSSASTGMSTDTSATAPAPVSDPAATMSASPGMAVNPTPSAAPPSMPMTPPTDAAPQPNAPPVTPPAEPK